MSIPCFKIFRILFVLIFGLNICVNAQESNKAIINKSKNEWWIKPIKQIEKSINNKLVDFTNNDLYVFGGMGLAKQNVDLGNYSSGFNYNLSDFQKNMYKPGYFGGFRVDGIFKKKHAYSISFSLNKVATGTNLSGGTKITPFVGDFITMKPEDQFLFLSIAPHYKKLLQITDTSKYKLYAVVGPSIDWRLSDQSLDNQVNNNYRQFQLKGDLGLEFDNKTYYTLFLHYHHSLTSITQSPIGAKFNAFEIGIMLKAKDLF